MYSDTHAYQIQGGLNSRIISYNPAQKWYYDSALKVGKAYMFATVGHKLPGDETHMLGTPHGAFILGDGQARTRSHSRESWEVRCPLMALDHICSLIEGATSVPNEPKMCQCPEGEGLLCAALSSYHRGTRHNKFDAFKVAKKLISRECTCARL